MKVLRVVAYLVLIFSIIGFFSCSMFGNDSSDSENVSSNNTEDTENTDNTTDDTTTDNTTGGTTTDNTTDDTTTDNTTGGTTTDDTTDDTTTDNTTTGNLAVSSFKTVISAQRGVIKSVSNIKAPVEDEDTISVGFRSSDVEFWSTEEAGGSYTNFISAKWADTDPSRVSSIECSLPNVRNTFSFTPGEVNTIEAVEAINFQSYIYDIVRIDIGAGVFEVRHNGELVDTQSAGTNPEGDYSYKLVANSIMLVDRELLGEKPVYIEGHEAENIETTDYNDFIKEFIKNNMTTEFTDGSYKVDVNGALFIPFDGIDLRENYSSVTVGLAWDVTSSFNDSDDDSIYEAQDRVNGTPFDFMVQVNTEAVE